MKFLLKILLALLAIPVAAVAAVHLFFDPNDYKNEIIAWVGEATGRRLTLEGDLGLSLFPWIGLEVRGASLSQPAGFGPEPFARIQEIHARIKPLPLLQGRVELEEVLGTGVTLNLIRGPDGRANWDDLAGVEPAPGAVVQPQFVEARYAKMPEGPAAPPLPAGSGKGIALAGVRLLWDDQEAGNLLVFNDLTVKLPHLEPNAPLALNIAGNLVGQGTGIDARLVLEASPKLPADGRTLEATPFSLRLEGLSLADGLIVNGGLAGTLVGDLEARSYSFAGLNLNLDLTGGAFQAKPLLIKGTADLDLDNKAQTLALRGLVLESGKLRLQGDASGTQLQDQPQFKGRLALDPFDPRAWLAAQGLPLPAMADPTAFTQLALRSPWEWAGGQFDLKELDLALDKTRIAGAMSWLPGKPASQHFDLRADRLNLDAYLPPPRLPSPTAASGAMSALDYAHPPFLLRLLAAEAWAAPDPDPVPIPNTILVEVIRDLNLTGRLRINQLLARGLTFGDFDGRFTSRDGRLRMEEQVARFYAGKLQGHVEVDANQTPLLLTLNQQAEGVNVGDLLKELTGEGRLTGTGRIQADLSARGLTEDEIVPSLSGTAALQVVKGSIEGFDLEGAILSAEAGLLGRAGRPKGQELRRTEITNLSGTARVDQGVLDTQDIQIISGYLHATGKGRFDLPRQQLDLRLEARVVDAPPDRPIKEIEGIPVPILVSGSFQFPEWRVDPSPVIKELGRRRLDQELERGEGNRIQRLEERTGIRGLEQGLKSLLGR